MTSTFSATATESPYMILEPTIIPKPSQPVVNYKNSSTYSSVDISIAVTIIVIVTCILVSLNYIYYRIQTKNRERRRQENVSVSAIIIHTNPLHSISVQN